ncbi:MAG: hypothetical protein IH859_09110, partial [Chloroflexi bacterium]|nr:hypothetical protein [Chloroflexota bacterium]
MEQLARLTINLIRTNAPNIRFAVGKVKENVDFVVKLILAVPDPPLSRIHSTYLGPYYSGTSQQTLLGWLTELTNALVKAEEDDEDARAV